MVFAISGRYLKRVEHYQHCYQFRIYTYVLMSNHLHLLLETGQTPLSKSSKQFNSHRREYCNRRYGTVGHLFQGRYKAIRLNPISL
jgi:hypothetical protein